MAHRAKHRLGAYSAAAARRTALCCAPETAGSPEPVPGGPRAAVRCSAMPCSRMDDANFDAFFAPLLRGADDLLLVDATWRLLYASQPLRADDTLALLRAQLLSGKSLSDGDGERSYYVGACAESGFSLIRQQPQTYTAQVVRSIYLVAALMGALCLVLCLVVRLVAQPPSL